MAQHKCKIDLGVKDSCIFESDLLQIPCSHLHHFKTLTNPQYLQIKKRKGNSVLRQVADILYTLQYLVLFTKLNGDQGQQSKGEGIILVLLPLIFVDQKENRKRKRQSIADLINYQLVCVEIGFTQKWHRDAKFNCEISV